MSAKELKKPQSVIHFAGYSSLYGGNFIASLLTLETVLKEKGFRQVLVFPEAAKQRPWCARLLQEGHAVLFLRPGSILSNARCIAQLARCENAMILHTHFSQWDIAAWLASIFVSTPKLQVVWHKHSEDFAQQASWRHSMKRVLRNRLIGRYVWQVNVGEHLHAKAVADGFPVARSFVVLNGIDVARATSCDQTRKQALVRLGFGGDDLLLLLFGWDPFRKGVDVALAAMDHLALYEPRLRLAIVGGGDERLLSYLSNGGDSPGRKQVVVLPPTEDVSVYFRAATLFISASRAEGFSYGVCEAMANCLPIISSDIPGLAWVHEAAGVVFYSAENNDDLASGIRDVLAWSPENRNNVTSHNARLVSSRYNVLGWAHNVLGIYQKLLSMRKYHP